MEQLKKKMEQGKKNEAKAKEKRFGGEKHHQPSAWQCPNSTKTPTLPHGHFQQQGKGEEWKSQGPELPLQAQPGALEQRYQHISLPGPAIHRGCSSLA